MRDDSQIRASEMLFQGNSPSAPSDSHRAGLNPCSLRGLRLLIAVGAVERQRWKSSGSLSPFPFTITGLFPPAPEPVMNQLALGVVADSKTPSDADYVAAARLKINVQRL